MSTSIEAKKAEIEKKIEALKQREKILNEQEKRKRARKYTEIGRIADRAGISGLSEKELLGAFLEIAEQHEDEEQRARWKGRAEELDRSATSLGDVPILLTIEGTITTEIQRKLKDLGLKWNAVRKEWYGYGVPSKIGIALSGLKFNINEVSE
jgi:Conjugal transfer protein TraD